MIRLRIYSIYYMFLEQIFKGDAKAFLNKAILNT